MSVRRAVEAAWSASSDMQGLHLRVLRALADRHLRIDPWYYDLAPDRIQDLFPGRAAPAGPPGPVVAEEPPFVAIQPWIPATAADLARCPLVIKTPSNAYRMAFWRALFPNARLRVLHLVRNAAAAVNGLHDGWRFRGFHVHPAGRPLSIRGYSDAVPGGDRWWKFDLPPSWEAWCDAPLESVCGFQWRSAHAHILDFLAAHPEIDHHRLRFEDVVGPPARRRAAFADLVAWLGQPPASMGRLLGRSVPPVMCTSRPRARRWYEKAALLTPVVEDPRVSAVMERLGYALDPDTWL